MDYHYCIILDARSDKYIAIARETIERLAPWLSGWKGDSALTSRATIPQEIAEIAGDLVRSGVLTRSLQHGKAVRPQEIPAAHGSAIEPLKSPARRALGLSTSVIRSLFWARNRLSSCSLISTIDAVAALRASPSRALPESALSEARRLIAQFHSWRALYARPHACMFESLSLLHFLSNFSFYPSWIFGVVPEPFQAHCWLQHGDIVLNDTVDHTSAFTPIMLV